MFCWTTFSGRRLLTLVAILLGLFAAPAVARDSNSLMDISADGRLLACSNRDGGTVSIVDLKTLKKLRETPVGVHPEGVAFVGKTHTLAVAIYNDDSVAFARCRHRQDHLPHPGLR